MADWQIGNHSCPHVHPCIQKYSVVVLPSLNKQYIHSRLLQRFSGGPQRTAEANRPIIQYYAMWPNTTTLLLPYYKPILLGQHWSRNTPDAIWQKDGFLGLSYPPDMFT